MKQVRLRTPGTREKIDEWLRSNKDNDSCPMCDKPAITEYTYWKIQINDFPYDHLTKRHHLLTLKRHSGELRDLTPAEIDEYNNIAHTLHGEYTCIMLNLGKTRSVPKHLHYHLLDFIDNCI